VSLEYDQSLVRFPGWAPKPPYRVNGRPVITMVEWCDRLWRGGGEVTTGLRPHPVTPFPVLGGPFTSPGSAPP